MPKRECSHHNCNVLVDKGSRCQAHNVEADRDRYRAYDKGKRDGRAAAFYNSSEWKHVKRMALRRDRFLCGLCLVERGVMVAAELVHHKLYLSQDWNQRLTLNNLISLCHFCHNQIHKNDKKEYF